MEDEQVGERAPLNPDGTLRTDWVNNDEMVNAHPAHHNYMAAFVNQHERALNDPETGILLNTLPIKGNAGQVLTKVDGQTREAAWMDASGTPAPKKADIGQVLTATGVGKYSWEAAPKGTVPTPTAADKVLASRQATKDGQTVYVPYWADGGGGGGGLPTPGASGTVLRSAGSTETPFWDAEHVPDPGAASAGSVPTVTTAGKVAWVNHPEVTVSTSAPSPSAGNNGDIWIVVS